MNHSLSDRRIKPLWQRMLIPGGGRLYWAVLGLLLLIASARLIAEPLLRPLVANYILDANAKLSEIIGKPVVSGYDNIYLSLSLNGLIILVIDPYLEVDTQTFQAQEASLVLFPGRRPQVTISNASLSIAALADNTFVVAGIPLDKMRGDSNRQTPLLPFDLVAEDITIQIALANGNNIGLNDMRIAISPKPQLQVLSISFQSGTNADFRLSGKATWAPGKPNRDIFFYLRAAGFDNALRDLLAIRQNSATLVTEIWGNFRGGNVNALAQVLVTKFIGDYDLPGDQLAAIQAIGDHARVVAEIEIADTLTASQHVVARWHATLQNIRVTAPEPYLGGPLNLMRAEASGQFTADNVGWNLAIPDVRTTGPLGHAAGEVAIQAPQFEPIALSVGASAAQVDVAEVLATLPLAVGEESLEFLREALRIRQAQLTTLVIDSGQQKDLLWDNIPIERFVLESEFFDASLEYADGYPPVTEAHGGFGIDGTSLAVTVAQARIGPARLGLSRAGISDTTAAQTTLFVAADSILEQDEMIELITDLPATRQYVPELEDLRIDGRQTLDLALTIPLDSGDEIQVSGSLAPEGANTLTYLPLDLTLTNVDGEIDFDQQTLSGITTGDLFDSSVRVSVGFGDAGSKVKLNGTFDLAKAAKQLKLSGDLPLKGKSPVAIEIDADGLALNSTLRGTAINLPGVLGKLADQRRNLVLRNSAGRTRITYGDNLAHLYLDDNAGLAIALGDEPEEINIPNEGTRVRGRLNGLDLDELAGNVGNMGGLPLPVDAELTLSDTTFLGMRHPEFAVQATIATTITVASVQADALAGRFDFLPADELAVSLAYLNLPKAPSQSTVANDATIYVEPSTLTPNLPKLSARISKLKIGEVDYQDVFIAGKPIESIWQLDEARALIGKATLRANGYTNIKGNPYAEISLTIAVPALEDFLREYGNKDTIGDGNATINGKVSWEGALFDPHYFTMQGTVTLAAKDFVIRKGTDGIRLLDLLSPFTLLESLPIIGSGASKFSGANGNLIFGDSNLNFDNIAISSPDLDIKINGSTNLITHRNDIYSQVQVNASQNIVTGAVAALNPITGAVLLLLNQVSDNPILGQLALQYHITGTWKEPIIQQKQVAQAGDETNPN